MSNTKAIPASGAVTAAIQAGISYLRQHQYPNGEYCCYMGPDDALETWCVPDSTVFPASLISWCLKGFSGNQAVDEMQQRTKGFLQYQIMRGGVWNHFTKWHPLFPYCPADTDNAVCAAKVLQFLQQTVDNRDILLANRNTAGLFYTWYAFRLNTVRHKNFWLLLLREFKHPLASFLFWRRNECSRNDIDAVVNANILFYLGHSASTRPIITYLARVIAENQESDCDKWYRNPFTVYYFICRNYSADIPEFVLLRESVIRRILGAANTDGSFGCSPLDTALGLTALLDLKYTGTELDYAASALLQTQLPDGEWPRRALFYSGPSRTVGWGSEEMSTAFSLEALGRYIQLRKTA